MRGDIHVKFPKVIIFISVLLINVTSSAYAETWREVLSSYEDLVPASSLIVQQFTAFQEGTVPVIADGSIKSIPIRECEEPLVDLTKQHNVRIRVISIVKVRRSIFLALQRMITYLDNFAGRFGYGRGQLSIQVCEGLRSLARQASYFATRLKILRAEYPEWAEEQLKDEVAKWISPLEDNIPAHATGAAIDIRLWDSLAGTFVDMGEFGALAGLNPTAPTFCEELTDRQKENRLLCLLAAQEAGLANYPYEAWHYSRGDRYATYWLTRETAKQIACYGIVKERRCKSVVSRLNQLRVA